MKKLSLVFAISVCASMAGPAYAADGMAGMNMPPKTSAATPAGAGLTEAEVKKIEPTTGMITLKHRPLPNVGMPAMTMAFKAKDAAMVRQVSEGDKVKVRIENLNGTLTIVAMTKEP